MTYLTLTQAAALLPHRPHPAALWRWCRKGIVSRDGERIRLMHLRVGGRILVTREAIEAFGLALAEHDSKHFEGERVRHAEAPCSPPPKRNRDAAIHQARAKLADEGV